MRGESGSDYHYGADYPYLRQLLDRTGTLRYDLREILTDYGVLYRRLGLKPGNKLIDIGSCIGSFGHFLKYGGIKTYGVDLNFSSIKAGRELFGVEKNNQSVVADAINLPFPTGFFDTVVTRDVLEHFPSLEFADLAFEEMERVLKPERKTMFHKITVAEDARHIDDDESHRLKWTTDQWSDFFIKHKWSLATDPNLHIPIIGKTYPGYFLIQRNGA